MKKITFLILIMMIIGGCSTEKKFITNETKATQIIKTSGLETNQSTNKKNDTESLIHSIPKVKLTIPSKPSLSYDYVGALFTVDRFLADWLNRDWKSAAPLITDRLSKNLPKSYTRYFTEAPPAHVGYEVIGYKKIDKDTYQFKIWRYVISMGQPVYGKPEFINVIRGKNNSWLINNVSGTS